MWRGELATADGRCNGWTQAVQERPAGKATRRGELCAKECTEHLELGLGTGDEPVKSLQGRIRGQTDTADTVVCFCYRPPD